MNRLALESWILLLRFEWIMRVGGFKSAAPLVERGGSPLNCTRQSEGRPVPCDGLCLCLLLQTCALPAALGSNHAICCAATAGAPRW